MTKRLILLNYAGATCNKLAQAIALATRQALARQNDQCLDNIDAALIELRQLERELERAQGASNA